MKNVCLVPALIAALTVASAAAQQPAPSSSPEPPAATAPVPESVPPSEIAGQLAPPRKGAAHNPAVSYSFLWWEIPLAIIVVPVEIALVVAAIPVCIVGSIAHKDLCPM